LSSIDKPKGEKYWKITFYIDGKRYRRSLRVEDKRSAQQLKTDIDFLIQRGALDPDNLLGFQKDSKQLYEAISEYLTYTDNRKDLSDVTKHDYHYSIGTILKMFLHDQTASKITRNQVEFELRPSMEKHFGSISTVRHHMLGMSAFFGFLVRREYIDKNPFSGLVPTPPKKEPVFLPEQHIRIFLDYWRGEDRPQWQRLYFPLMLNTGLRQTSLRLLDWNANVFLQDRYLRFPAKGKYAGKWRSVPLNDYCIHLLMTHPRKKGETRVFYDVNSKATVDTAWRAFRKTTGLPYTPHNLRSNYATHFMKNGGELWKLMQIMGWTNYEAAKIYLAFSPDFIENDRNRVQFDQPKPDDKDDRNLVVFGK